MPLSRPKLIVAVIAAVVVVGGATVVALQKPKAEQQMAGGPGGKPGGPGGGAGGPGGGAGGPGGGQRGPGGPGGPGGRGGGVTGVDAVPAAMRPFTSKIEALGTLAPREQVTLTANAADRVTGVFFEDGQRVRKGATLVTLIADEEKSQLASAQATADNAKLVYERNQRLAKDNAIAELELEKSKSTADAAIAAVDVAQARLRDRILLAPFDGVLGFRQVSTGAYVSPGQPVAKLIDDSEMRLEFAVPSVFVGDLKKGLEISATSDDVKGRIFKGQLTSIDNSIDNVTRTVKVRATLPNRDGVLKAGMFMGVSLMSKERKSIAIPEISVIAEGPKTFVFVIDTSKKPGVAKRTEVQIGARERGTVEVVSGLKEGDMVVTDGVLKLRPNAPVRIAGQGGGQGNGQGGQGGQGRGPRPQGGEGGQPGGAPQGDGAPALSGAPQKADTAKGPLAAGEGPSDKAGLRQ